MIAQVLGAGEEVFGIARGVCFEIVGEVGEEGAGELDVGGNFGHGGGGGLDVFAEVEEEGCEVCAGLGEGEGADGEGEGIHGGVA